MLNDAATLLYACFLDYYYQLVTKTNWGSKMQHDIHPIYAEISVTCSCGESFKTRSSLAEHQKDLHLDVCSKCHPFFTGQQRAAQARGRIEQFNKRYGKKA